MHPALALALLLIAGIGITRLSRPALRRPPLLDDLLATGVPFLLLGLLLGPGLGVIDATGLRLLQPIIALGIGWSGALFGARLEWRMVRRLLPRTWLIGATLALPVLLVTTTAAWVLAHAVPSLAESWGRPSLAVSLVLAGALTTAASQRGPRLGRRNALFDTAFGAATVIVGVALYHPHVAVRSILLTLLVGGALGGLFVGLGRGGMLNEPHDAAIAAFGGGGNAGRRKRACALRHRRIRVRGARAQLVCFARICRGAGKARRRADATPHADRGQARLRRAAILRRVLC